MRLVAYWLALIFFTIVLMYIIGVAIVATAEHVADGIEGLFEWAIEFRG